MWNKETFDRSNVYLWMGLLYRKGVGEGLLPVLDIGMWDFVFLSRKKTVNPRPEDFLCTVDRLLIPWRWDQYLVWIVHDNMKSSFIRFSFVKVLQDKYPWRLFTLFRSTNLPEVLCIYEFLEIYKNISIQLHKMQLLVNLHLSPPKFINSVLYESCITGNTCSEIIIFSTKFYITLLKTNRF